MDTPTTVAPADGAILVPTGLAAMPSANNHHTCSQGVLHVHRTDLTPLCPSSSDDPASLGTASAAPSDGVLQGSQADGQQVITQPDHGRQAGSQTMTAMQAAAAGTVDSIVADLVEDALSYYNMATDCAADAVVEQLVSEAICDTEAANYAMNHRRAAAMAVDSILDQLVSHAAADDEAAQIEVVDTVLDDLVSKAVVDVEAAQAELLFDIKQSQAVDAVLEQIISNVSQEVRAESAAAMCQPLTTQSRAGEPGGSLSKKLSTGEADQAVGPHPSYLQCEDAVSSQAAARQQLQQLRRKMELLSRSISIQTYQVPIPAITKSIYLRLEHSLVIGNINSASAAAVCEAVFAGVLGLGQYWLLSVFACGHAGGVGRLQGEDPRAGSTLDDHPVCAPQPLGLHYNPPSHPCCLPCRPSSRSAPLH